MKTSYYITGVLLIIISWVATDFANVRDLAINLFCRITDFEKTTNERNYFLKKSEIERKSNHASCNTLVIIGDSHISSLHDTLEKIENLILLANNGETINNFLYQMDYLPKFAAKKVIIHLGYNDLKCRSVSNIISLYKQLTAKLACEEIVLISALPVDKTRWITNSRIRKLNSEIIRLTSENKNTTYLNVYDSLVNKEGSGLDVRYNSDGTHVNQSGSSILLRLLLQSAVS